MSEAEDVIKYDAYKVHQDFMRNLAQVPGYANIQQRISAGVADMSDIFRNVLQGFQIYESDDGFFLYTVRDPIYKDLHLSHTFQDDRTFDEEWYNACDTYIENLTGREKYILARYTRHGDEVVNALLRDPEGFNTNERAHSLLFDMMPTENAMLYAMQLVDLRDPDNHYEYVNYRGVPHVLEYRELETFEEEYLAGVPTTSKAETMEKIKPLVYMFIEDLRDILWRAPRLEKPLQVFRATNTDYLKSPYEAQQIAGFLSTSLDASFGEFYNKNKYIYQLTLQPGTPCLCIKDASKYYSEFEVLVDLDCFAMSSVLMEKHNLQNDRFSGDVAPDHLLVGPMNPKRLVRHIEIAGSDTGGRNSGSSRGSRGSRSSKRPSPTVGGRAKSRATLKISSSSKKVKGVRITRRHSKLPTRRLSLHKSPRRSFRKMAHAWEFRDPLPPRVVKNAKVPPRIKERLLTAHKKAGTYFKDVAR